MKAAGNSIDSQLRQWAAWYARVWVVKGIGHKNKSPIVDLGMPTCKVFDSNERMWEADKSDMEGFHNVLMAMSAEDVRLVKDHYCNGVGVVSFAATSRIRREPPETVRRKVMNVWGRLEKAIANDRAIG